MMLAAASDSSYSWFYGIVSAFGVIGGSLALVLTLGSLRPYLRSKEKVRRSVRSLDLANELREIIHGSGQLTRSPEVDRDLAGLVGELRAEIIGSQPTAKEASAGIKPAIIAAISAILVAVGGPFSIAYANKLINPPAVSCVDERSKAVDLVERHPEVWVPIADDNCGVNDMVAKILNG